RAAIAVADAEGLDAVSMRRVASEVKSGTTSLSELSAADLPDLPAGTALDPSCTPGVPGGTLTLLTHTPTRALAALLPWAARAGADELPDLRVHRPTLEDVYLKLIRENQGAQA
ncbi:hypothetical protein ACWCSD_35360, partial [Nonomuraea sp. NPDC001684]